MGHTGFNSCAQPRLARAALLAGAEAQRYKLDLKAKA
jgi:hypothetical protein